MPSWLGVPELIIILIILLVIFGPKRLPEIGRSVGKGIREFKKSTSDLQEQLTGDEKPKAEAKKAEAAEPAAEGVEPKKAESNS